LKCLIKYWKTFFKGYKKTFKLLNLHIFEEIISSWNFGIEFVMLAKSRSPRFCHFDIGTMKSYIIGSTVTFPKFKLCQIYVNPWLVHEPKSITNAINAILFNLCSLILVLLKAFAWPPCFNVRTRDHAQVYKSYVAQCIEKYIPLWQVLNGTSFIEFLNH
jgi:hypothetical protein